MDSEEKCLLRKKIILVGIYGVEIILLIAILVALFWRAMSTSFSSLDYIKRSIEASFLQDVTLVGLNDACTNEKRTAFAYEFLGIKKGCLCNSDQVVENKSCPLDTKNECNINKTFEEISDHELDIFPFSFMQPKKKICGTFVSSFDYNTQIASDFGKCSNLQFKSCGRICWPVSMKCPITALRIIDNTNNQSSESQLVNDKTSLVIERDTNSLSSPLNQIIISKLPFICISDEDTTRFEKQAQKNNVVNMACQQDILSVQTPNGSTDGSIYLTTNSITIDDTQVQYFSHATYNIFQKPLVIMAKDCYGETFNSITSLSSMSTIIQLVYIQSIVTTFIMVVIIVVFSVLHLMFKIKNNIFETALITSMVVIGGSQIVSFIFYRYYDIIIQDIYDKQCFGDNQQQINELISSARNELKIANTLSLINACSPLILLAIHILINCFQSRIQRLPNSTPRIMLSQPSAEGNLNQQQLPVFDSGIISAHSVRKQAPSMSLFSSSNFNEKTNIKK